MGDHSTATPLTKAEQAAVQAALGIEGGTKPTAPPEDYDRTAAIPKQHTRKSKPGKKTYTPKSPSVRAKTIGQVTSDEDNTSHVTRVDSEMVKGKSTHGRARRSKDLSGSLGKDVKMFTDHSWKQFLTMIANGARKPDLLKDAGITNASFNLWVATTEGAAAEYENARLQWLRRDWPLELIEDICVEFIMDKPISKICAERDLDEAAFWRVILNEPYYQEMFDESRRIHMERQGERLLAISDEIELDGTNTTANSAKVNKARLMSDNRRWLMERLHPERYGKVTKSSVEMDMKVDHTEELKKARKRNEHAAAQRQKLLEEAERGYTVH